MTAKPVAEKELAGFRPVICIVGPTGSGKSALALRLAKELNGEIVNCDSLQLYRGFDIGSAKPSVAERESVLHHLIDVAGPGEVYTAGEFARQARVVLRSITERGKLPIVVGGTGFYLKALIDGLIEAPARDETLRDRLARIEKRRPGRLHAMLVRWDPVSAEKIAANDVQKQIRALELMISKRKALSAIYQAPRDADREFQFFQIGLSPSRAELYQRLDRRCVLMLEQGLMGEVEQLLAQGYRPEEKPFGSIGYKQALQVHAGNMALDAALEEMQRDTRRYAKRQWTWFRRDQRVHWLYRFGDGETTVKAAIAAMQKKFFCF
jgi:tRNA dimethylallyltransferase